MSYVRIVAVTMIICAASLRVADAQTKDVAGRVVDSQNMDVANATVTLASASGKVVSKTAEDGTFSLSAAGPGAYTLLVEAGGFARWSQNITVSADALPITISLQIAGLSESISVVGSVPATLGAPTLTGTRLGLTPLETPASVSIVSGTTVRERGDRTVADAKTRAVGVTMQGDPGNGCGSVVARGFGGVGSVMQLFDGDQLFVGAGTVTFPFDPWSVERIEVLGGPSSVLYGNGAIGGVVNVVPRKPNPFSRENSIKVGVGSFNTWRGAVDSAGPINASTSYRLDLSGNRSSGWVNGNDSNALALSASVRHQFSPTLSLTVSEDFGHQRPGEYFGSPTFDGVIDESRRDVNYNVSDSDIWYRDSWSQAKIEWQPARNIRVRSGLHILATNRHWRNVEEYFFEPDTGLVNRDSYIEIFHRQRQYGDRTDVVLSHGPTPCPPASTTTS